MEFHISALTDLCRVCGNRAHLAKDKKTPVKMCATYAHDILAVYGLSIKYDSSETHPNKLCSSCYQRLINTTRMTIVLSLYQQHTLKICGSRIQQIAVYVCIPVTYLLVPEQS